MTRPVEAPPGSHSVVHATFRLERTYPVPPKRVFDAFQEPSLKRRWSVEADGGEVQEHTLDFRIGGSEATRFQFDNGPQICSDAVYQDIVQDRRIVYAFRMTIGGRPAAVALTTVELAPSGDSTLLVYTEQGAFLDGMHPPDTAEHGSGVLLQRLGEILSDD
jgi:uncharacterized protein YndB with AHSA1/START domain